MITLLLVMTAVSFSMRALPFLLSDTLQKHPLLSKLASTLPPCILFILVAHTLEGTVFKIYPYGIPECIALACVGLVQSTFRNLLASMLAGVLVHQIFLHIL